MHTQAQKHVISIGENKCIIEIIELKLKLTTKTHHIEVCFHAYDGKHCLKTRQGMNKHQEQKLFKLG